MAKIYSLKISNYRGIQKFNQVFGFTDFVCLIGRGDSGKTTILDAISKVLSPSWNLPFYDTDFYNSDIDTPIEIEAVLYDLPQRILQEEKYGLYIQGLNKTSSIISKDFTDKDESVLVVKLVVNKYLEPQWSVIDNIQEPKIISARDRALFNVFLISDYIDRHFSWNIGSPLYSILKRSGGTDIVDDNNIIIDSLRDAKDTISKTSFNSLNDSFDKVKSKAGKLGIDISGALSTIDFKDLALKDGKVCLHEDNIPFRLKGKGAKRLISIAIQSELAESGGIMLIDEIEQGLEPDRAQHLAKTLKEMNTGQVFITSHSRDVIVELDAKDLFLMKKEANALSIFSSDLQGCLRNNPEAFFARKILVCEGATEVGFCRALNSYRIYKGKANAALRGVRFVDGTGSRLLNYAKNFKESSFNICMFCDSDVEDINKEKDELRAQGICVVDCEEGNSIEQQVFLDLPWKGVQKLIEYRMEGVSQSSMEASLRSKEPNLEKTWQTLDSYDTRKLLGYVSSQIKGKEWFKRIDHGIVLGSVCCEYLEDMTVSKLYKEILELSNWIDNDRL